MNKPQIKGDSNGIIRCKQGYLAKGTWSSKENTDKDYDMAYGKWQCDKKNNLLLGDKDYSWSGECEPENCKPQPITNSDKEFDVLTGNIKTKPQIVKCNEGYSFSHGIHHQGGKVKCDYELKKSGLAGLFSASLELTKEGLITIMQNKKHKTLLIKQKNE